MTGLFDQKQYDRLKQLLQPTSKVLIVSHINPDGDAVGASLGLALILKPYVHQVDVVMPNRFPDFLKWMYGASDVVTYNDEKEKVKVLVNGADIIFCLDFNNLARIDELGTLIAQAKAERVLIDHHLSPANEFSIQFSYIPASSTAELVYRIGVELTGSTRISREAAEALYCGIMTDTGSFSHSSSQPKLFHIVANLLECGIDKDKISSLVYDNFSAERMKLLGYTLCNKMTVVPQLHSAYIALSREELHRYSFKPGDTEGFVNYPLSINGVVLSIFLVESLDHIKVSLRSRGEFSVNDMARAHFNGGGHKNAAGGKLFCSLPDAVKLVESILPDYEKILVQ